MKRLILILAMLLIATNLWAVNLSVVVPEGEEETHASEHAVGGADTVFPADPNADKFLMWDDDPGQWSFQDAASYTFGTGLTETDGHVVNTVTDTDTDDQTATEVPVTTSAFGGIFTNNTSFDSVQEIVDFLDDYTYGSSYDFGTIAGVIQTDGADNFSIWDKDYGDLINAPADSDDIAEGTTNFYDDDGVDAVDDADHDPTNELPVAGFGIDISGTPASTVAFDPTEIIGANTWAAGADVTFAWTWDVATGTDPIITFGNNYINVSTGALQVGGNAVLTAEVDGSISNELPIAGNYIDVYGTPASTVAFDPSELTAVTWGNTEVSGYFWTWQIDSELTSPTIGFGDNSINVSTGVLQVGGVNVLTSVDMSSNTNLSGGRSTTMNGDAVDADAELYTDTKCIYIEDPTADDDLKSIWRAPVACTITSIWAESDQTVTFMLQVDDGSAADVDSVDLAPAAGTAEDTSLNGDTTMAAGDRLDIDLVSVSGTPTWVSICWTYTKDD